MYKARLKDKYKTRSANDHALAATSRIMNVAGRWGCGVVSLSTLTFLEDLELTVKTKEQQRNTPR